MLLCNALFPAVVSPTLNAPTASDPTLNAALVGGIVGGVGGSLLLVIIVLLVIFGVLKYQKRSSARFNIPGNFTTQLFIQRVGCE